MKSIRSIFPFSLTAALAGSIVAPVGLMMPAAADAGDASACLAAARANVSAHSYHTTMMMGFRGTPQLSTVDFQKPDRIHEAGPGHEMIVIGKQAWMKMNGGPWKSMPGMAEMTSLVSMDPTRAFNMQNKGTCSDGGVGLWKGRPAHIFKGISDGRHGTVTATMYQLSDGYVHHVDVTSASGTSSFDFSNFNSTTVSPP